MSCTHQRNKQYSYKVAMSNHLFRWKWMCMYFVVWHYIGYFLKPKHVTSPFLPYSKLLHGYTYCRQYLLLYVKENVEDNIKKFLYLICIILWTDSFMSHSMITKNCKSIHTCTSTIGHLDSDWFGNYLYTVSLRSKHDNQSNVTECW